MLDTKHARDVQKVMGRELTRSMKGMHLKGHPKPYFMSYLLRHTEGLDVWGRYGAIFNAEPVRSCDLYTEVRVGSHKLDQVLDGGLTTDLSDRESFNWLVGPQDLDTQAVRYAFWKLTQLKYWEALQAYYDKRALQVDQRIAHEAPSYSKEPKLVANHEIVPAKFSVKRWEGFVRKASDLFKGKKGLVDPFVRIRGLSQVRVFVNSEGSKFIAQEQFYEVLVAAWSMSKEGVYLSASRPFYGRDPDHLPKMAAVEAAIEDIGRDLASLARAEPMEPYAGPALLSGAATGLMFHEAIGHRLEGERMVARSEGRTFAKKIGQRILPPSVQVVDDPTLATFDDVPLYGHYAVDDEGVGAQPVTLVKDGVLKTFLMSRACTPEFRKSNGHGRHERFQDPMARMANLIVSSEERRSWDELKEGLLAEVRAKQLPYGIIVKRVSSGETRTDHYDFQAFKGVPTEVYRVDAKSGREVRVRDVNFIGTPLAAIQRIKAFGEDYEVDNSYCFAESGSVPVATVAPAMLVDELELQRANARMYRPPVLPIPPMRRAARPTR